MGFSQSWIAVRGKSPDAVLAELGWRGTGEREEVPESPVVSARLPTGWLVIVMNDSMDAADGAVDPARLSRGADVVTCMVEEHVMVSAFASWNDGKRLLEVGHNGQEDPHHLDVTGSLSPELQQIVDDARRAQAKDDENGGGTDYIFDIPVDMAYRLTGFRHDLDVGVEFEILERVASAGRGPGSWWKGLFRRRGG